MGSRGGFYFPSLYAAPPPASSYSLPPFHLYRKHTPTTNQPTTTAKALSPLFSSAPAGRIFSFPILGENVGEKENWLHFLIKKEEGGYPFRGRKIEEASEGEIVTEIAFPFFFFSFPPAVDGDKCRNFSRRRRFPVHIILLLFFFRHIFPPSSFVAARIQTDPIWRRLRSEKIPKSLSFFLSSLLRWAGARAGQMQATKHISRPLAQQKEKGTTVAASIHSPAIPRENGKNK